MKNFILKTVDWEDFQKLKNENEITCLKRFCLKLFCNCCKKAESIDQLSVELKEKTNWSSANKLTVMK